MSGRVALLSWFRRGLSTAVSGVVSGPRARIEVGLGFNQGAHEASVTLPLEGPGEVTSVDQASIVRTWPEPGTGDADPTTFALLELSELDLPWRYTPAAPKADRLDPWLSLLVLEDDEHSTELLARLESPGRGLPRGVRIAAGTRMPDPSMAWAWAHVQVALDGSLAKVAEQVQIATTDEPERGLARIMCARRLRPNTRYLALLVPRFERGRLAGLDRDPGSVLAGKTAWKAGANGELDAALDLPVYHSWSFATGPAGDFESLSRRLRVRAVPPWMGFRAVDGSEPGPSPLVSAGEVMVPGALQSLDTPDADTSADQRRSAFAAGVAARIAEATSASAPSVTPPLYGRWPAARSSLARDPAASRASKREWMDQLNSDPAWRLIAGEGARVVQTLERELMAEAWAQAGDVERANEELRRAGLAREAAASLWERRLVSRPDDAVLQLTGLLADRVEDSSGSSIAEHLKAAQTPRGLLDPTLRRMLRPTGRLGRARSSRTPPVSVFAGGTLRIAPTPKVPGGMVTLQSLVRVILRGSTTRPDDRELEIDSTARLSPERCEGDSSFDPELRPWFETIKVLSRPPASTAATPVPAKVKHLADAARKQLDPRETISRHYRRRLRAPEDSRPSDDPLDPVIIVPRIARPMVEPLVARSIDWLLPGLGELPPDSLALVRTNRRFVESYMAGLNHEMARELLWNGYPSDPAGTVFHRFWDVAGHLERDDSTQSWKEPDWERFRHIRDLHTWKGALGSHQPRGGPGESIVLLVSGALLQRYPRTQVVAIAAKHSADGPLLDDSRQRLPVFSGRAEPGVAFFGFDISVEDALGSPGWFLALVEPATATRFGLDADLRSRWPKQAQDLAFSHFGAAPGDWLDLRRAGKGPGDAIDGVFLHPDRGATAATVAELMSADIVRVVFHAGQLFGGKRSE